MRASRPPPSYGARPPAIFEPASRGYRRLPRRRQSCVSPKKIFTSITGRAEFSQLFDISGCRPAADSRWQLGGCRFQFRCRFTPARRRCRAAAATILPFSFARRRLSFRCLIADFAASLFSPLRRMPDACISIGIAHAFHAFTFAAAAARYFGRPRQPGLRLMIIFYEGRPVFFAFRMPIREAFRRR